MLFGFFALPVGLLVGGMLPMLSPFTTVPLLVRLIG